MDAICEDGPEVDQCCIFSDALPGCGGSFLDNEINFLAKRFSNIYIFADFSVGSIRSLPKNVHPFCINTKRGIIQKVVKFSLGLLCFSYSEKAGSFRKFIDKVFCKGVYALSLLKINKIIRRNHINFGNCLFYSFWLNSKALLALHFRDIGIKNGHKCFTISRAHGGDIYTAVSRDGYQPFQRLIVERVNYVFPCSNFGTNYLKNKYPSYSGKISTAHLGTNDFGLNPPKTSSQFLFVTCSNLIKTKRVLLFANAFALLSKRHANVKWVCFGDGEERAEIKSLVERNHLSNVMLMGFRENSDVIRFYQNTHVDLFVNVSTSEGLPVSIMEASSFGIPCIATNVGGTSDLVNNQTGRLVNASIDVDDLCEALDAYMDLSPEEQESHRKAARTMWEKGFADSFVYTEWVEIINKIVKES
jgi:colanic acid/amylovoran biosynthesis glycosyltransferase